MPTISVDEDLKTQITAITQEYDCSIKGAIYLLLSNKPKTLEGVEFANRMYPTRQGIADSWDSFWNILVGWINNHPAETYTAKQIADLANCSESQMKALFNLLVEQGHIKETPKGYKKTNPDLITITQKEARQKQYDLRATLILNLLGQYPDGIDPKEVQSSLSLTPSQMKGCAKNPIIKAKVDISTDLWKLKATKATKATKSPIKRKRKKAP